MTLTTRQVARLEQFLETLKLDTYPEPPTVEHNQITEHMMQRVFDTCSLPQRARVLDVGCGQGVALRRFAERGCDAIGITLNETDAQECRRAGYRVAEMDQSFLDFPDGEFDLVWCRHCLEHSIFPYFTLREFSRVLKPEGWLYVEVPAPGTSCRHEENRNHYSVLGKEMWASLITRAGFSIRDVMDINLTVPAGPDTYWAFTQQKEAASTGG